MQQYGRITRPFWVKEARHIIVPTVNYIMWIIKLTKFIYNAGNQISDCLEREKGVILIEKRYGGLFGKERIPIIDWDSGYTIDAFVYVSIIYINCSSIK